jgi:hypothetical protein
MDSREYSREFFLGQGGPLYRFYLRARLAGKPTLTARRIVFFALLAWLPPLILSAAAGNAIGGVKVPFMFDIANHIRLLVSLPLLVMSELLVDARLRKVVEGFVKSGIVASEEIPRFDAIIVSILRWRDSAVIEAALAATTLTVAHRHWFDSQLQTISTWQAVPANDGLRLTAAGFWYAWISMSLFQFLVLRWFFRWSLWSILLWRVSHLRLRLLATHPDHAGGLSFLTMSGFAFAPMAVALSTLLSGIAAGKIFFEGATLVSFQTEFIAFVVLMIVIALGPLCVFSSHLMQAKLQGWHDYGELAGRYVEEFDRKWNRKDAPDEELLGSADIQSLADMGNSYGFVAQMRFVPFDRSTLIALAGASILPLLPLALTIIPFNELVAKLLGAVF